MNSGHHLVFTVCVPALIFPVRLYASVHTSLFLLNFISSDYFHLQFFSSSSQYSCLPNVKGDCHACMTPNVGVSHATVWWWWLCFYPFVPHRRVLMTLLQCSDRAEEASLQPHISSALNLLESFSFLPPTFAPPSPSIPFTRSAHCSTHLSSVLVVASWMYACLWVFRCFLSLKL